MENLKKRGATGGVSAEEKKKMCLLLGMPAPICIHKGKILQELEGFQLAIIRE